MSGVIVCATGTCDSRYKGELPHHLMDDILLHENVEHQGHLHLLVVLVSEALWCAGRDSLLCVQHLPDTVDRERVKLTDKVLVHPLRLVVNP
jgi:hypothetical protein